MSQKRMDAIAAAGFKVQNLATLLIWAGNAAGQTCFEATQERLSHLGFAMQQAGEELFRLSEEITDAADPSGEWSR
ncbi:hypothetical protein AA13595_0880 [Gluconacetobacter johannae DSM 13595]|uniref:Uncharacterized protein n=1 Tax=Gluconacetobacter johannae TaxID=112140 RepID=A0A7W4P7K5_9PROT|nr:hypothetical protein [Gluconacetobacter johannae]MBB2177030.1 hypothetical protein [Gluconacetobacter johannae]GBQ82283.1 hypothetical protein AA13595_0880 [Gluconacetobacter johannae DSM 13595]